MGDVVLLTGGTGFLGTDVATRLLARDGLEIVALVPARTDAEAVHAATRAWWHRPELRSALGARIHAVAGDVGELRLALDDTTYGDLSRRVTQSFTRRPTCGSMPPSRTSAGPTWTAWPTS